MKQYKRKARVYKRKPKEEVPQVLVCPGCDKERPRYMFYPVADPNKGATKQRRRLKLCSLCRDEAASMAAKKTWTWADAVCKATAMAIAGAKGNSRDFRVTPQVVTALVELQCGLCALTGVELHLPANLSRGQTLDAWAVREGVVTREASKLPVLVKLTESGEWAPGNVAVIVRAARELVTLEGTLQMIKVRIVSAGDVKIFTRPQIQQAQLARELGLRKQTNKKETDE